MFRYAVINESLEVVNLIKWDGQAQWSPPEGHVAIRSDEAFMGDLYDPQTKKFVHPQPISQE